MSDLRENCTYLKFFFKVGEISAEVLQMLVNAFGNDTLG